MFSALELIAWFELAPVHGGFICICSFSGSAGGPTEIKIRPEREDHGRTIDIGLQAYPFLRWRNGKVEHLAKDDGIGFAHARTHRHMEDLSLQKKRGGV